MIRMIRRRSSTTQPRSLGQSLGTLSRSALLLVTLASLPSQSQQPNPPANAQPSYRLRLEAEVDGLLSISIQKPWGTYWPSQQVIPTSQPAGVPPSGTRRRAAESVIASLDENLMAAAALHIASESLTPDSASWIRARDAARRANSALGGTQQSSGLVPDLAVAGSARLAGSVTELDRFDVQTTARAAAFWILLAQESSTSPRPAATVPATNLSATGGSTADGSRADRAANTKLPAEPTATNDLRTEARAHAIRALYFLSKQQTRSGAFAIVLPPDPSLPRKDRKAPEPLIRLSTTEYRDALIALCLGAAEFEQPAIKVACERSVECLLRLRLPGTTGGTGRWAEEYFADGIAVVRGDDRLARPSAQASINAMQGLLAVACAWSGSPPQPASVTSALTTLEELRAATELRATPAGTPVMKAVDDLQLLGLADFVKLAGRHGVVRRDLALLVLGLATDGPTTNRPISRTEARRYLSENAAAIEQALAQLGGSDAATRARRITILARLAEIEAMAG